MYGGSIMTAEKMREIIIGNVSFDQLEKDKGIYEFYEDGKLSIGVSFESKTPEDDKIDSYIYNLFCGDQYINISGYGTKENPIPEEVLGQMVQEWNGFVMLNENKEQNYEEVKSVMNLVSKSST